MSKVFNEKKFFKAVVKCGHVSKKCYIPIEVYLVADSKKEAAKKCKVMPRVKRDHKDFILAMHEITYEDYLAGKEKMKTNPYLLCKNKQEQDIIMDQIATMIVPDPHYEETKRKQKSTTSKKKYVNRYADCFADWEDYAYAA